ncbi:MAG TPA: SDR family oxidoreductase [Chloroflexota bacterium]|nr:SDR family oxidoreductase [Chloroflexota bacterium]
MEPSLTGKVALVTGAGKGMGRATAERFLAAGAKVVATDAVPDGLESFAGRERATTMVADVSRRSDVESMIELARQRFGRLHVLVNNAGIMDRFLPVGEVTDDVWNHVLAVNLTGPMMASRAAIPLMLETGGGVIINVASVGGLHGGRAGAAYTASKHGLVGLTRNIAATYAREGIRCVAVCPGGVNTGISIGGEPSARGFETLNRTLASNVRMGEPEELAQVIAFLASDEASFVNGAVIVADGGWIAA